MDLTDPHAREMLQDQLRQLQHKLDDGKAMNAYYRKHKTLKGYPGISDETAAHMDETIQSAYSWAQKPMPDYELTSLRGKIKRTQARLEELDKLQARRTPPRPPRSTTASGSSATRSRTACKFSLTASPTRPPAPP